MSKSVHVYDRVHVYTVTTYPYDGLVVCSVATFIVQFLYYGVPSIIIIIKSHYSY